MYRVFCLYFLFVLTLYPAAVYAEEQEEPNEKTEERAKIKVDISFQTWIYVNHSLLVRDSILNPGNQISAVPETQAILDGRLDMRIGFENQEIVLHPRLIGEAFLIERQGPEGLQEDHTHSSRLRWNEAFYRLTWVSNTATVGRELYAWGPATFRSPSNPFYFDSGRVNPLSDTPGIDLIRLTHLGKVIKVTGTYVFDTNMAQTSQNQNDTALLKLDRQGSSYLASMIISERNSENTFIGSFMQATLNDAWLVYSEWSSRRLPYALVPLNTISEPFYVVEQPSKRAATVLAGTSYTLSNGQVLTGEYLNNGHGYARQDEQHFFRQASSATLLLQSMPGSDQADLAAALRQTQTLLSRNYLYLEFQSNPQDTSFYWRGEWVRNIDDHSHRSLFYMEKNFIPRVSGFIGAVLNTGRSHTEFGALVRSIQILGIKVFIF
jgi:hypothetical protein